MRFNKIELFILFIVSIAPSVYGYDLDYRLDYGTTYISLANFTQQGWTDAYNVNDTIDGDLTTTPYFDNMKNLPAETGYVQLNLNDTYNITHVMVQGASDGSGSSYCHNISIYVNDTMVYEYYYDGVGEYNFNQSITPTIGNYIRFFLHGYCQPTNYANWWVDEIGAYGTNIDTTTTYNSITINTPSNNTWQYDIALNVSITTLLDSTCKYSTDSSFDYTTEGTAMTGISLVHYYTLDCTNLTTVSNYYKCQQANGTITASELHTFRCKDANWDNEYVFIGDSTTYWHVVLESQAYTTLIEPIFQDVPYNYTDINVINEGEDGDCISNASGCSTPGKSILERYEADIITSNPRFAMIQAGTNDECLDVGINNYVTDYNTILSDATTQGLNTTYIISTLPNSIFDSFGTGCTQSGVDMYNQEILKLAIKYRLPIFNWHYNSNHDSTYLDDLVHQNVAGHQKDNETIAEFMLEYTDWIFDHTRFDYYTDCNNSIDIMNYTIYSRTMNCGKDTSADWLIIKNLTQSQFYIQQADKSFEIYIHNKEYGNTNYILSYDGGSYNSFSLINGTVGFNISSINNTLFTLAVDPANGSTTNATVKITNTIYGNLNKYAVFVNASSLQIYCEDNLCTLPIDNTGDDTYDITIYKPGFRPFTGMNVNLSTQYNVSLSLCEVQVTDISLSPENKNETGLGTTYTWSKDNMATDEATCDYRILYTNDTINIEMFDTDNVSVLNDTFTHQRRSNTHEWSTDSIETVDIAVYNELGWTNAYDVDDLFDNDIATAYFDHEENKAYAYINVTFNQSYLVDRIYLTGLNDGSGLYNLSYRVTVYLNGTHAYHYDHDGDGIQNVNVSILPKIAKYALFYIHNWGESNFNNFWATEIGIHGTGVSDEDKNNVAEKTIDHSALSMGQYTVNITTTQQTTNINNTDLAYIYILPNSTYLTVYAYKIDNSTILSSYTFNNNITNTPVGGSPIYILLSELINFSISDQAQFLYNISDNNLVYADFINNHTITRSNTTINITMVPNQLLLYFYQDGSLTATQGRIADVEKMFYFNETSVLIYMTNLTDGFIQVLFGETNGTNWTQYYEYIKPDVSTAIDTLELISNPDWGAYIQVISTSGESLDGATIRAYQYKGEYNLWTEAKLVGQRITTSNGMTSFFFDPNTTIRLDVTKSSYSPVSKIVAIGDEAYTSDNPFLITMSRTSSTYTDGMRWVFIKRTYQSTDTSLTGTIWAHNHELIQVTTDYRNNIPLNAKTLVDCDSFDICTFTLNDGIDYDALLNDTINVHVYIDGVYWTTVYVSKATQITTGLFDPDTGAFDNKYILGIAIILIPVLLGLLFRNPGLGKWSFLIGCMIAGFLNPLFYVLLVVPFLVVVVIIIKRVTDE